LHYDLTDQYLDRDSIIHSLDPRVKVFATLAYVLTVSLTLEGTWWAFGVSFTILLVISWMACLKAVSVIRRSYVVLPFVLAAILLPFTMPGPILYRIPIVGWSISQPGLIRFLSILLRSWLAVQAAILLTLTTRFTDLLWALGAFRLPRPLVSTIGFMYRYLFVLVDEARRMRCARAARSATPEGTPRPSIIWQGRVTGAMVGSLFLRALDRSERVYAAMLSRGYDGHMRSLMDFRMGIIDWTAILVVGLVLSSLLTLVKVF
jgi:cobalt/nickel transport system permease protein